MRRQHGAGGKLGEGQLELIATELKGVFFITGQTFSDARGAFREVFSSEAFQQNGQAFQIVETNISFNRQKGTLRGMHFSAAPYDHAKVVHVAEGRVHDVVLDLRPESDTYLNSVGREISAEDNSGILIPAGCAHGFLTLTPRCAILYHLDGRYSPEHARVVRWNDPSFGIDWPSNPRVMSDRDQDCADFQP